MAIRLAIQGLIPLLNFGVLPAGGTGFSTVEWKEHPSWQESVVCSATYHLSLNRCHPSVLWLYIVLMVSSHESGV